MAEHPHSSVLALERRCCAAMVEADAAALDRLLHDNLVWIHASGRIDGKATLIAMLLHDRPYLALDMGDLAVRDCGVASFVTGTIAVALAEQAYVNLFTHVWLHGRLIHGQATRAAPVKPERT